MKFDKREVTSIIFIGNGLKPPKHIVQEGDEAVLFHNGNFVMANVSSLKGNQILGTITRSMYEPDLRPEFTTGKEIQFLEENIFGITKMAKKD